MREMVTMYETAWQFNDDGSPRRLDAVEWLLEEAMIHARAGDDDDDSPDPAKTLACIAHEMRDLRAALATAQRERAEWEANAQRENAALVQAQEIIAKLEAREWEVRCCAANVLLAFEDWPEYQTETADGERRTALDSLAVLLAKAKGDTP